jgi:methyl-accepting chemotaxis protein
MGEVLKAVEQIQKASSQSAGAAQQSSGYAVDLRTQVVALGASVREVDKAVATLEEQFFGL